MPQWARPDQTRFRSGQVNPNTRVSQDGEVRLDQVRGRSGQFNWVAPLQSEQLELGVQTSPVGKRSTIIKEGRARGPEA